MLGLLGFSIVSHLSSQHLFSLQLDGLARDGVLSPSARAEVMRGFSAIWGYSNLISAGIGAIGAALLSYWAAHRISNSLLKIEQVAYELANGNLQKDVPTSSIPELARLGKSLSRMVSALKDVEQRRRSMITDVSHELRTPLTVVRGYLEEIESDRLTLTPDICRRLVGETKRLERLVNNLQELSKAESGSLPLSLRALAVAPLLAMLVEKFSGQLLSDGPTLEIDVQPDLPAAWADSDRTEQILVNLLSNAIRHTKHGSITLKSWCDRDATGTERIWIAVVDTGPGLGDGELPHVFERFWRSARSRRQNNSGTGIGLAITRQLVTLQGGQIFAESEPGVGSTFKFWLPKANSKAS